MVGFGLVCFVGLRLFVTLQGRVILIRQGAVQWLMYSEVRTILTLFLCWNGGSSAVLTLRTAEINSPDHISLFEKVYLLRLSNSECYIKLHISHACDNYRTKYFRESGYTLRRVLATNAVVPHSVAQQCTISSIEIMDIKVLSELLNRHKITMTDIDLADQMRLKSLSELGGFIRNG